MEGPSGPAEEGELPLLTVKHELRNGERGGPGGPGLPGEVMAGGGGGSVDGGALRGALLPEGRAAGSAWGGGGVPRCRDLGKKC